jgi:hypothetical protein
VSWLVRCECLYSMYDDDARRLYDRIIDHRHSCPKFGQSFTMTSPASLLGHPSVNGSQRGEIAAPGTPTREGDDARHSAPTPGAATTDPRIQSIVTRAVDAIRLGWFRP